MQTFVRNQMATGWALGLLLCLLQAQATTQEEQDPAGKRTPAKMLAPEQAGILLFEGRVDLELPLKTLNFMGLRDGDIVADIGCGNGFYTLQICSCIDEASAHLDAAPPSRRVQRESHKIKVRTHFQKVIHKIGVTIFDRKAQSCLPQPAPFRPVNIHTSIEQSLHTFDITGCGRFVDCPVKHRGRLGLLLPARKHRQGQTEGYRHV